MREWLAFEQLLVLLVQAQPGFVQRQPLNELHPVVVKRVEFIQLTGHHCLVEVAGLDAEPCLKRAQLGFQSAHILEQGVE